MRKAEQEMRMVTEYRNELAGYPFSLNKGMFVYPQII
jgi:hypothetical protein